MSTRMAAAAARTVDATKVYGEDQTEVRALDGVTVEFARAEFTAIMGPSGSGKSTLLHCVAGLDSLTSGHAFIGAKDLSTLNDRARRHETPGRALLAEQWLTALDAPATQLTVAVTSGHRAMWEQPDAFHRFMTETVLSRANTD
jgi:predicted ABC-type transport system involved in lysophospholipase L1 biosynthesis ATPase subunit